MSDTEIEVVGEASDTFDASLWISKGRKFPATPPLGLRRHIDALLSIPDAYREYLPGDDVSVEDLLNWKAPEAAPCDDIVWAEGLFSPCTPNGAVRHFLTKNPSLPPRRALESAHEKIGQAVLDGMQSFCDTRYSNTYLPLWTISVCRAIYHALSRRESFLACLRWIDTFKSVSKAGVRGVCMRAREVLLRVRWQGNICDDLDVSLFLRLLSDMQISDGLVDSLVQWTIREGRSSSSSCAYFADGMAVWDYIGTKDEAFWAGVRGPREAQFMGRLEERLKRVPSKQKLLFPVRLSLGLDGKGRDRGHFFLVEVDPASTSFTFGKSHIICATNVNLRDRSGQPGRYWCARGRIESTALASKPCRFTVQVCRRTFAIATRHPARR